MKAMTKIALLTVSFISVGALSACQSTTAPKDNYGSHMMGQHKGERHMTPEQREQVQQLRAQHKVIREQGKKACDGKVVGETVQINTGDKTIIGSCNMVFKVDHKYMREMRHELRHDNNRMMYGHHDKQRMQEMTAEQRAQMKQQFEQKRTERQAKWEAIQQACVGQPNGQAIRVKMGDKSINGTCRVQFKVPRPMENLQAQ
ncbi:hypothetical protein [Acinetobacter silvestris]|uniref:Lipoprotein n=1 Tax=Acinetobacter silvestris TaxID=1977882 RepID=A0A1Y3CQA2_9GAMM|nr:hypothetical protein [Acinetobacter silvestris]OTG67335.1 hypothetical protein B9T28_01515 [Acinetobacter silvestris]